MKSNRQNPLISSSQLMGIALLAAGLITFLVTAACSFSGAATSFRGGVLLTLSALGVILGTAFYFSGSRKHKKTKTARSSSLGLSPAENKDPHAEHYDPAELTSQVPSTPPPFLK